METSLVFVDIFIRRFVVDVLACHYDVDDESVSVTRHDEHRVRLCHHAVVGSAAV